MHPGSAGVDCRSGTGGWEEGNKKRLRGGNGIGSGSGTEEVSGLERSGLYPVDMVFFVRVCFEEKSVCFSPR